MQINSVITVPYVPASTGTSATKSSTQTSESDQTELQISSPSFSELVQAAKSSPEVRSEVVAAYTAQVASGHYPPPQVISELAGLLSGSSSD